MIKYLLTLIALLNTLLVPVAFAANNDVYKLDDSHLAEPYMAGNSLKNAARLVKKHNIDQKGAYLTIPSRCKLCHTFDKKDGSNSLFNNIMTNNDNSCDWCHNDGAGSMYHVSMDNEEGTLRELGVGHSLGYGLGNGKWKSPDDTYPAFTPKYWRGGLSCSDCHPAHDYANQVFKHTEKINPYYNLSPGLASILKRDPDPEIDEATGKVIDDTYLGNYSPAIPYPVKGVAIDWDDPKLANPSTADDYINVTNRVCADCHDGDAGLHSVTHLVYSEDAALQGNSGVGLYTKANGHDARLDNCMRQAVYDPEDKQNNGPNCRSCHKGSNDCDICHKAYTMSKNAKERDAMIYIKAQTKNVMADVGCSANCISLGISYPHRTLGTKMLKDELFGIDINGGEIKIGQIRQFTVTDKTYSSVPAHDLDSVCVDCHNPIAWNPRSKELLPHGLP